MCTFNDNVEEMREKLLSVERNDCTISSLRRIVRSGVGDINPTDVLVAHSAKGDIQLHFY
jgi:translation initiation factor IF-2